MAFRGRSLVGETAYISGASAGIGAAIALRLAQCGASVVLGARRKEKLDAVAETIRAEGKEGKVWTGTLDVNDGTSVDAWLAAGEKAVAPCSILVNNAGLAAGSGHAKDADLDDWDRMLNTNVRAVFALTRKVLPGMLSRGCGDLVNIASVAGIDSYPGGSVYCATKAALQKFAECVRKETVGQGIRVLTFDPGLVETEFSSVRFDGDAEKAKAPYAGVEPLTGDDVADCVAFAVTRERRICIDRMLILASQQANATLIVRH
ncbi:MAG: SDR family NAD(P)-dependent oxidoreductase [Deltaproteobacteria bacterium]|nr:SDR family NAD(P)-dependent oxidoreductase [Deltaproteobacteria bacterium]